MAHSVLPALWRALPLQQLLAQQQGQQLAAAASTLPALLASLHGQRSLAAGSAGRDRDAEERASFFRAQKLRAQQQQLQQQGGEQQQPGTALVTVKPNETRASLAQVAGVVRHQALIVTRPIEWGTVIFGFEQANRYTVYDQDGQPVAQLMEDYTGLGNELGRQLLRTRRSFTATVFSADGTQVIFKLRRPMYLINSTMFIEDGEGKEIGEIRQKWHPIRRNYDLYLHKQQFAAISGTFLAWEFELKDEHGRTLALVDRNFQGFGKELFTDAGKYVIHFGTEATAATAEEQRRQLEQGQGGSASASASPAAGPPPSTSDQAPGTASTTPAVIPTFTGNQLVVHRPLALDERMITLAAAITIDFDFFSQHSNSGGWLRPPIIMPLPGGGGAPVEAGDGSAGAGGVAGAASAGAAGEVASGAASTGGFGSAAPPPPPPPPPPQSGGASGEAWMGGDEFQAPPSAPPGDGEMQWDLPSGSGAAEESGSTVGGVLGALWSFITGGDD